MKSSPICHEGLITQQDQLPVLPPGVPYLLQALADENISYQKLEVIIGRFPSIAARLLSLANSAWASPKVPVTSLKHACSQLGLALVRSVSITLSIASPFAPTRCPSFDAERFWCAALLAADGAVLLASSAGGDVELDAQTLHTAGLLHNLGLLWLAHNRPQETAKAFETVAAEDQRSVKQCLQEILGVDYCEIGGCLGRAWSLPGVLVTTMEHQGNPDYTGTDWQSAAVVGGAAAMVSALFKGLDRPPEDTLHLERLNIKPAYRDRAYVKLIALLKDKRELARALIHI